MLGDTFIFSPEKEKIVHLFEGSDEEFEASLASFKYIDFEQLSIGSLEIEDFLDPLSMTEGEPVFFFEEEGIICIAINPEALEKICNTPLEESGLEEFKEDIEMLRKFISEYGAAHIYSYTTF